VGIDDKFNNTLLGFEERVEVGACADESVCGVLSCVK
jgi:hypothetical protein